MLSDTLALSLHPKIPSQTPAAWMSNVDFTYAGEGYYIANHKIGRAHV